MVLYDIAALVDGEIVGDGSVDILNVRKIEDAHDGDISFIANHKYEKFHAVTRASALLVDRDFHASRNDINYVRTDDPYAAFLLVLRTFAPVFDPPPPGVHPTAVIGTNVTLGEGISVGPYVVIGDGCMVGDRTLLYPHVVVGPRSSIGADSIICAHVTLYSGTRVGDRAMIHSGAVLGADGFGFVPKADGSWEKMPQIGVVVLEDDVEIGANCTIDRASLGETRIESGAKLDNLIHIAHNVVIGRNTVIAAQTGISGSTKIGPSNMIAGQVGIVGHIETSADVIIEAQSGVSKSIRKPGRYFGHPVKEHAQALRQEGALRQLPDLLRDIRDMRNRITQLEATIALAAEGTTEP